MPSAHRSLVTRLTLAAALAVAAATVAVRPAHAVAFAPIVVVEGSLVYDEGVPVERSGRTMWPATEPGAMSCKARPSGAAKRQAAPKKAARQPRLERR